MNEKIRSLVEDEERRLEAFPIARSFTFMAHAAVTALPAAAAQAVIDYTTRCREDNQEFEGVLQEIEATRETCARVIGADRREIALLGPTSLGLSLFANGIDWKEGDEVLCYLDDYPANVYPWQDLKRRGVRVTYLKPEAPGVLTPELVESALTARTRLVALSSCNFLTGYRIDIDAMGLLLRGRGVLFSLDGIQTIGAFDTPVHNVDFLSADAHKWMLGPLAIGIVYVARRNFDTLRPSLLGAWNVHSPDFVAQESISLPPSARRYEPGVLNVAGALGMKASLDMLLDLGIEDVSARILELKDRLVRGLEASGFEIAGPRNGPAASGITTFSAPGRDMTRLLELLQREGVAASPRRDRAGNDFIRLSPHFYNTPAEIDRVLDLLANPSHD